MKPVAKSNIDGPSSAYTLGRKKMKKPIPPRSVVALKKLWPHARKRGHEIGQKRRVGYYSRQDGLDCVWLVDDEGNYGWTTDHKWLYEHFEILKISDETDLFGVDRRRLRALSTSKRKTPNQTPKPTAPSVRSSS